MRDFKDRIQLNSAQRKEVEKYIGTIGVLNEFTILKLVRKIKEIERKIEEKKYEK